MTEPSGQSSQVGATRPGVFYGWRMVGVAFFIDFIAVGFFFYSYGVFYKALAAELGGSRFGVGMGLTVSAVVSSLAAPFFGRAVDRYPLRRLIIGGALAVSTGFLLLSRIDARWQFYLILGTLLALGMSCMGGLSTSKLVANWFDARRGMAFGVATMGISLSGMIMPPIAVWLIHELGWRGGFSVYGLLTLVLVIPVAARFVVNRPEEMGLRPDGGPLREPALGSMLVDEVRWRTREILRSRTFWAIALPFALVFSALSAILTHMVPHVTDLGFSAEQAAFILSATAGAGVLGKVIFGWLVDRADPRIAVWCSFGTQLAGLLLLMNAQEYGQLLVAGSVFGLGMGGTVPLQGAITGIAFGRLSFGKVMGLLRPVMVPLHAIGVPFAGWVYDRTGSYDLAFQFFVLVFVVASAAVSTLRPGRA